MGMLLHRHYMEWELAEKAAPAPVGEEKTEPAPAKPKQDKPAKKPAKKTKKQE